LRRLAPALYIAPVTQKMTLPAPQLEWLPAPELTAAEGAA
jgi:hypothetical protein